MGMNELKIRGRVDTVQKPTLLEVCEDTNKGAVEVIISLVYGVYVWFSGLDEGIDFKFKIQQIFFYNILLEL